MSDLGIFDPLLGRLRSSDTTTINTTRDIHHGGSSSSGIQTGLSVPAGGTEGDLFYDTDDTTLYVYANGMWNPISGGGGVVTDGLRITANGGTRITQNGGNRIVQAA